MTTRASYPSNIFLIGYMGSGKTTFGKKLARVIGYRFLDMDQYIEKKVGRSIPELFEADGEGVFRTLETEALGEVVKESGQVIATGGGMPCFNDNVKLMNANGQTVYLELTPEALVSRLRQAKEVRPLVHGKDESELRAFISQHLASREKYYKQATLIYPGLNPDAEALAAALKNG
ncbi:MAG: shikimate kinase [Flavobacteriales bacterium]|nr:shikimate kinase [Flavobacteriales bacterium]